MKIAELKKLAAERQDTMRAGAPGTLYALHVILLDKSEPENTTEWYEFVTFDNFDQLEDWIRRAHPGAVDSGVVAVYTTRQYFSVEGGELDSPDMTFVARIQ